MCWGGDIITPYKTISEEYTKKGDMRYVDCIRIDEFPMNSTLEIVSSIDVYGDYASITEIVST